MGIFGWEALWGCVALPVGQPGSLCSLPLPLHGYSPCPWGPQLGAAPPSLTPWGGPQMLLGHCCPWRCAHPWQEEDV